MKRSSLPWRLLGLLAVAILPALGAMVFVQIELRNERMQRASDNAVHQAELLSGDMKTLVDGARQLAFAIAHSDSIVPSAPSCTASLDALRQGLGGYVLVAVLTTDGRVLCAARAPNAPSAKMVWDAARPTFTIDNGFRTGSYLGLPGRTSVLPFYLPFSLPGGQNGIVLCAIDLDWLQARFERLHMPPGASIGVADRDGRLLVRLPERPWRGRLISEAARTRIGDTKSGLMDVVGLDGRPYRLGYVPPSLTGGIYVGYALYMPSIVAGIDNATRQGYVLLAIGTLISLLLMQIGTTRLVHQPTEALLNAAQRWSKGDLAARAHLGVARDNEFGRLAFAFNLMAETLEVRQRQLQELNVSLETAVEERTLELSQTNNRLLVEINERERTDAALRQTQKLGAVGQLAGGVAHEFNNLLTTVMGALELLRVRLGAGHALSTLIDHAQGAAQRGGKLTGQLLAFAHRRRLLPVAVDFNAVIEEMRDLLASTIGRSIEVVTTLAPDLQAALADRHEVEAAILNLALNAREAMPQGGKLTLATRNTLPPQTDLALTLEEGIELSVTDDGRGMTEEELAHAVDPFFSTKPKGEGSGLGLSQAHGLMQQLGGALRIESRPGHGTVVRLWLPRAAAQPVESPVPFRAAPSGRRLLLVDDDAPVRQIAADMLTEMGYEVAQAPDGASALRLLDAADALFDVLVADYSMPGMTGVELIAEVQRIRPSIVSVVITGFIELSPNDTGRLDPRQVVRKPFTIRELRERIEERMRLHNSGFAATGAAAD